MDPVEADQPEDEDSQASSQQRALTAGVGSVATYADSEESCPEESCAKEPVLTSARVLRPRHHFLSELQRRRVAEIFKGGSRLLKIPFPFLLVCASYD